MTRWALWTCNKTFVNISRSRQSNALAPLFASHPPSKERLASNRAHAATLPKGGARGTARYQQVMQHLQNHQTAYQAYEKATAAFAEADFTTAQAAGKQPSKLSLMKRISSGCSVTLQALTTAWPLHKSTIVMPFDSMTGFFIHIYKAA